MRYIVTLFWSLILGQVVGFIGSNLTGNVYSFTTTCFASLVIASAIMITESVAETKEA